MKCNECIGSPVPETDCIKQQFCFGCDKNTLGKYGILDHQKRDLENRFTYHPPTNDQVERYNTLRMSVFGLATIIVSNTPSSREQDKALDALDTVLMFANASIARRENGMPDTLGNLCDSCEFELPTCDAQSTDIVYGNGMGGDNIIECPCYKKTAPKGE